MAKYYVATFLFCFVFLIFSTWLKWILNKKRKRREKGTWSVCSDSTSWRSKAKDWIYIYIRIYIYIYICCCCLAFRVVALDYWHLWHESSLGASSRLQVHSLHTHTHCNITEKPSFLFQISPPETVLILSTWKRLYVHFLTFDWRTIESSKTFWMNTELKSGPGSIDQNENSIDFIFIFQYY